MKLYQYGCRMRPPAPGAIPKRNLYDVISGKIGIAGTNRHYWGIAEYTELLNDEEVEEYELDYIGTAETEDENTDG